MALILELRLHQETYKGHVNMRYLMMGLCKYETVEHYLIATTDWNLRSLAKVKMWIKQVNN